MLAEELGYALAPRPFFSNACAALLLVAAGTPEQRERWLGPLAAARSAARWRCGTRRRGARSLEVELEPTARRSRREDRRAGRGSADFDRVAARDGRHFVVDAADVDDRARSRGSTRRASCSRCASTARRRAAGARPGATWRGPTARSSPRWRAENVGRRPARDGDGGRVRARTASSSTRRSAPTRRSRTAARRCCSRSRARARRPTTPAGRSTTSPRPRRAAASMAKAYAGDAGWRVTGLGAPGPRRDRLHLGARPPLLPQARARPTPTRSATRAGTASASRSSPASEPSLRGWASITPCSPVHRTAGIEGVDRTALRRRAMSYPSMSWATSHSRRGNHHKPSRVCVFCVA